MIPRLPRLRFPGAGATLALVAGCSSGSPIVLAEVSDDEIERVAGTWVNQLGLVQTDPSEWRHRLSEACTDGVWNPDVALHLADQYLSEDRDTFAGGDDVLPATLDAATALWTMASQVCPESFPAGALEAGPP